MTAELPDAIDCARLADEGRKLSGRFARERLSRVSGVYRVMADARAEFEFARDDARRVLIRGEIEAPLEALCQRCLEWMPLLLKAGVAVVAVPDEATGIALEGDDFVVAPGGRLGLLEFVEDEILLGCPMIPAHDTDGCRPERPGEPTGQDDRYRPFAGLDDLLDGQS